MYLMERVMKIKPLSAKNCIRQLREVKEESEKLLRHNMELKLVYTENLNEINRVNSEYELVIKFIKLNYNRDFWKEYEAWKPNKVEGSTDGP